MAIRHPHIVMVVNAIWFRKQARVDINAAKETMGSPQINNFFIIVFVFEL